MPWILALVLSAALFFASSNDSLARHFTYMQENPADRSQFSVVYPFNAVSSWWSFGPDDNNWVDDGSFTQQVVAAVQSWENAVPQLSYVNDTTQGYNIYFRQAQCGLFSDACLTIIGTQPNSDRKADYLLHGQIRLTLAQSNLTPLGIEDQLRHELGHWMGLDEQYTEDWSPSCTELLSVMNDSFVSNGHDCQGVHSPSSWDINVVTEYWNGAGLQSPELTEPDHRNLQVEWDDAAWQGLSIIGWEHRPMRGNGKVWWRSDVVQRRCWVPFPVSRD